METLSLADSWQRCSVELTLTLTTNVMVWSVVPKAERLRQETGQFEATVKYIKVEKREQ